LKNNLRVSVNNEYGELKSVLLGTVENMAWPSNDKEFDNGIARSTFDGTLTRGSLPPSVIEQANEDLNKFAVVMDKRGIDIIRPQTVGYHWAYSARDVLLTLGDKVIECPTPFSSRAFELDLYPSLHQADGKIIRAPKPQSGDDPMFDAANVLKVNDKLVYSLSHSANEAGAVWLQEQVGTDFEVITWRAVENQITHIDSTLLSCGENTIIANASRLDKESLPRFMKDYKTIWVDDCVPRSFHNFPYASKWIGMNVLSLDPETIVVDEIQTSLIDQLKSEKFNVVPLRMRQSRTLGGGFHCVTCDIERV
jgi:N-dimethylarginine dimethylaminohydrolase